MQIRIMDVSSLTARLEERRQRFAITGLSLLFISAGVSKFLITGSWIGFEPGLVLETLNLSSTQFTLITGAGEVLLGLWLLSARKTYYASLIASLWLLGITVQMLRLEAWTLAIRDMGLFFYALTVLLLTRTRS